MKKKHEKCQVHGCSMASETSESIDGIYGGVFLAGTFKHCRHHTIDEIDRSKADYCDELVRSMVKINPFMAVKELIHDMGEPVHQPVAET